MKRGGHPAKRPLETRTPGPKNMIREVRREGEGAAHGVCGCSSLRVRGWWMLTMNSHAVAISIAGCVEEMVGGVEEMVRDPNPMSLGFFSFFFFFFFLFFFHVLCFIHRQGRRLPAAPAMVKKNLCVPTGAREKAINPSLSGTRPTAH